MPLKQNKSNKRLTFKLSTAGLNSELELHHLIQFSVIPGQSVTFINTIEP